MLALYIETPKPRRTRVRVCVCVGFYVSRPALKREGNVVVVQIDLLLRVGRGLDRCRDGVFSMLKSPSRVQ